ncbi:hypothetical protein AB0I84_13180 [Streptomyces spectabilis]|uniref:hypothetical protein n=1 Tax=Streptomyces spectabilis TaxID=68270 RepID=UPI0034043697
MTMHDKPTPDFTSPLAGRIEVRDPCPHCPGRSLVPRSQMAEYIARMHPAVSPADAERRDTEPELTAEEARALADDLGLQLYRAEDSLAFVEECCVIADRERRTITTADVREWLKGARCGRQIAADVERRDRYAAAIDDTFAYATDFDAEKAADAVIAVADAEQADVRAALARVRALADAIDTELRGEPDTQRAAMQHEAVVRIRAALDGHPLTGGEQPPADRADLRDSIAHALAADDGHPWDTLCDTTQQHYLDNADAVLAVLPAPADRAAEWRAAADAFEEQCPEAGGGLDLCMCHAADELRRMADEAQPTEARPPRRRWYIEILDGNEWILTSSFRTDHDSAVRDMERLDSRAPRWADGQPVRRRIVRETTTHTVEAEHSPGPS